MTHENTMYPLFNYPISSKTFAVQASTRSRTWLTVNIIDRLVEQRCYLMPGCSHQFNTKYTHNCTLGIIWDPSSIEYRSPSMRGFIPFWKFHNVAFNDYCRVVDDLIYRKIGDRQAGVRRKGHHAIGDLYILSSSTPQPRSSDRDNEPVVYICPVSMYHRSRLRR